MPPNLQLLKFKKSPRNRFLPPLGNVFHISRFNGTAEGDSGKIFKSAFESYFDLI